MPPIGLARTATYLAAAQPTLSICANAVMINATLSIDGAIIIVVLTFVVILVIYSTRCWILRGMSTTRADIGLHLAFAANCLEMGLCTSAFILEKRVRSQHQSELEVEVFLVNKTFFVVSGWTILPGDVGNSCVMLTPTL